MNLTEKLNKIDHYCLDKDEKFYDLKSLYEAVKPKLSEKQKAKLEKVVKTKNPKLIEKTLRDCEKPCKEDWETFKAKRDYLINAVDNEEYKEALKNLNPYTDENYWEEVKSKQVMDSNGFWTNYTLYYNEWTEEYVAVFGDSDLYRPEDENWDAGPFDTEEEAYEWFDSYNGFEDEDLNESTKKDFIDAYTWAYGGNKKEAQKVYKEFDPESRKELVYGFKGNAKKSFLTDSLHNVEYLEDDLASKSKYKSIENAYQTNDLTIVKDGDVYYFERCPNKIANLVKKEMKKYYPELHYLYDKQGKSFLTDSLHDTSWTATDIVRDLYNKFPKVTFLDERDVDEDKVALFFKFGGDITGLEDLVKSYNCDYKISNGKMRIIAPEDEDYNESLKENMDYDMKYYCSAYYGKNWTGLEDDFSTNDMSEVRDWIWEKSADGLYTTVYDLESGHTSRIDPDDIIDSEGEFDIDEEGSYRTPHLREQLTDIEEKCKKKFEELKHILLDDVKKDDNCEDSMALQRVNNAFKAVGGKSGASQDSPTYIRYDGRVGDYTVGGSISGKGYILGDLNRLAEDLTMAYNVKLGGKSGYTPAFIKKITNESYIKDIKEEIVKFSPEDENEFEKLIEDFGWEIEDKGKTWLGSTHYQIINPKVRVFSEKSFDRAVETYIKPFTKEIDNFKKNLGASITWNFGANEDGHLTAGIDLHDKWLDESLIESADESYSYEEIESLLRKLTNNFTKEDYVETGIENEKEYAKAVLKKYYDIVEVSDGRRSKGEDMSWVIAYSNPKKDKRK